MEKVRKFLISDWFTAILFIVAAAVVFTSTEIIGTVAFVLVFGVVMALTNDWVTLLQIVMFTTCFAIRCKNSFGTFLDFWWVVPIMLVLIVCHFVRFRAKFSKGNCCNIGCSHPRRSGHNFRERIFFLYFAFLYLYARLCNAHYIFVHERITHAEGFRQFLRQICQNDDLRYSSAGCLSF